MKIEFEIEKTRQLRGKLFRNGRLLATGIAEMARNEVLFRPKKPKTLAIASTDRIKLKISEGTDSLILLKLAEGGQSTEQFWFLERIVG